MRKLADAHPGIARIDGRGLHWTIEFHGTSWRGWGGHDPDPIASRIATRVLDAGAMIATSGEQISLFIAPRRCLLVLNESFEPYPLVRANGLIGCIDRAPRGGQMSPKYVQVPVPEGRVEEVMRLLVQGESGGTKQMPPPAAVEASTAEPHRSGESWPEFAQMPDEDVRDAYRHASALQKRLWEFLAEHPNERFLFGDVADELEVDRHGLPGTLGRYAARSKKHYGEQRPHHIYKEQGGQWWMWMDERVARIVREEAS